MKDFIKRLSSRKFLLAVAACLTFYANKQYTEMAATAVAYIAAEGGADTVARFQAERTKQAQAFSTADPDAAAGFPSTTTDRGTLVPGSDLPE